MMIKILSSISHTKFMKLRLTCGVPFIRSSFQCSSKSNFWSQWNSKRTKVVASKIEELVKNCCCDSFNSWYSKRLGLPSNKTSRWSPYISVFQTMHRDTLVLREIFLKIQRTARCVRFWSWFTTKVCRSSKKFGRHCPTYTSNSWKKATWNCVHTIHQSAYKLFYIFEHLWISNDNNERAEVAWRRKRSDISHIHVKRS